MHRLPADIRLVRQKVTLIANVPFRTCSSLRRCKLKKKKKLPTHPDMQLVLLLSLITKFQNTAALAHFFITPLPLSEVNVRRDKGTCLL